MMKRAQTNVARHSLIKVIAPCFTLLGINQNAHDKTFALQRDKLILAQNTPSVPRTHEFRLFSSPEPSSLESDGKYKRRERVFIYIYLQELAPHARSI
jgi:hypothetical protein